VAAPKYLMGEVIGKKFLTPSMIRLELGNCDLSEFKSSGKSDEWVRLVFPHDHTKEIVLPVFIDSGWQIPAGRLACESRPYTVRRWRPDEGVLIVDFVVHEGGRAASWALNTEVGQKIGIGPAGGRYELPERCDWVFLLCDVTGLPAAGRILEELPASVRAFAHVEVPLFDDRQAIECEAYVAWHWYETFGQEGRATQLFDIARAANLPDSPGYIWIAGEASAVSESRKHFRDVLGFDKDRITSVGYWIQGQARE
jgi:NADPH-dependent ferric siderophore reductase